ADAQLQTPRRTKSRRPEKLGALLLKFSWFLAPRTIDGRIAQRWWTSSAPLRRSRTWAWPPAHLRRSCPAAPTRQPCREWRESCRDATLPAPDPPSDHDRE